MATKTLINIPQLFSEAWKLTLERWTSFIGLWFLQGVIMIVLLGGLVVAALPLGVRFASGQALNQAGTNLAGLGGIALLVLLAVIVVGIIFQGAAIALATAKEKIGVKEALIVGKQKWVALAIAGLVSSLLIIGATGLLVVPGIVLSMLLSFATYEIIANNQPAMAALSRSAGMVKQYFWAVVGRIAVLMIFTMGVNSLFGLTNSDPESANGMLVILEFIVQVAMAVFSLMYSAVLYRGLKAAAGNASLSLTQWTTASLVGWVALILFVYTLAASMSGT